MKTFVIKLGGSMVSRDRDNLFDFDYLHRFSDSIRKLTKYNKKFFITLGGGYLMRMYRDMAKKGGIKEDLQLHWIGTTINNLHAEIVRAYMHEIANDRIVAYEDYYSDSKIEFERDIIVGGGGRAGHSGDVDALVAANKFNIDTIISLKNVDGVYTKDPKEYKDAKRLDSLSWDQYLEIIGNPEKHKPGANFPIDPIASRRAQKAKKQFIVISGEDLKNLENVIMDESFIGTIVK
ncbi:MAG: hypothetical protein GF364_07400 [Candidatus Lokiarchaeota archaeon]|nr:hypothetical protein [Candidatus Lokiarchaeota archaeon]